MKWDKIALFLGGVLFATKIPVQLAAQGRQS